MSKLDLAEAVKKWPQLPEKPDKWTRRMVMHLNFGREGGSATFTIHDPDGEEMPFGYQYDTRKGGLTGFTIPAEPDDVISWHVLRERWPHIDKQEAEIPLKP